MPGKVVGTESFGTLISVLADRGYSVIGPTISEHTIVYGELRSASDLPIGWTDEQEAGTYRMTRRSDDAYFGYTVGPRTLKHYLFPPKQVLLTIEHAETGLRFNPQEAAPPKYAFIGPRACELAAVTIQDKVFLESGFTDPHYESARNQSFTVAVNCAVAANTCFCASMGTGPRCVSGYDLVVTEIVEDDTHEFIIEAGTEKGADVLSNIDGRPVGADDSQRVDTVASATADQMVRSMPAEETHELLTNAIESTIWDSIAERCISCTNCTLVCPTCFCSTVDDATDLLGTATRQRSWDSCFGLEFTNLHGHPVRTSTSSRYRQWMTHKLAYWYDQFGTSGCVGCGRCITWCPAGIDITAEIKRMRTKSEVMA